MKKSNQGFTILELMIVVVILGILGAVVVPKLMDAPDKANITKAKHDISQIELALDMYKLEYFKYPTTEEGLETLVPKRLKILQKDPWGNSYYYLNPGVNGAIDIYTYGKDGQKGGEGMNADIGNWIVQTAQ